MDIKNGTRSSGFKLQKEHREALAVIKDGYTLEDTAMGKNVHRRHFRTKLIVNPCNAKAQIEFKFHNLHIRES